LSPAAETPFQFSSDGIYHHLVLTKFGQTPTESKLCSFQLPKPNHTNLMRECISGATMMEIQDHAAFLHNRNSPAHQMDEEPAEFFPFVSPSRMSGVAISEEVREDLGYRNVIGQLYHSWVTDWWLLELGALVIAALCLGCIIIVLFVYRNSPLPSWPWGITLNTLLSVLSQVSNLGLMTALIGAFGQQKWLWFRKSRKSLNDFNAFDKASRGPWGSLLLLCSKSKVMYVLESDNPEYYLLTPIRHLGSIGAIAMCCYRGWRTPPVAWKTLEGPGSPN